MDSISRVRSAITKALVGAALAALAATSAGVALAANSFENLPAAARAQLQRGEQVVRTRDMPGSSWPAVTIYQLAGVPAEAAAAIFTDFGDQSGYLRDCCGLRQSVVRDAAVNGDARVQRVFYEISVPVFSNEKYELLETLSKNDDGSYTVTWKKIGSGGHSEDIVGRATFEPHGDGSLFTYHNFVKMNALGSGLFSGESVDKTKVTVNAMVRHMEQIYTQGGNRLRSNLQRLRNAVGD